LSYFFLISCQVISELYRRIQVCWRLDVRIIKHRYDTNQNCLDSENRSPSFLRCFLRILCIFTWRVQNRNADLAVLVDIGMPHFGFEYHGWWIIWIIIWELKLCLEVTAFVECLLRSLENDIPDKHIVIILKSNRCRNIVSVLAILQLLCKHLHCVVPVVALEIIHYFYKT